MPILWSILACHRSEPVPTAPPVATLVANPTQGSWPLQVTLEAQRPAGAEPLTFQWDLGDGSTAQGPRVQHRYTTAGTRTVSLVITDAHGARTELASQVQVTPRPCPTTQPPAPMGVVADGGLDEISGLALSQHPDRVWVHEDKQVTEIVALDTLGAVRSRHPLVGVQPVDTEDIAAAQSWLFLADIGDNDSERDTIAVYQLEEPDPDVDGEVYPTAIELEYPDGPHDAEALLVDPHTLDLFVVTKVLSGQTQVFRKAAPHAPGLSTLEQVATVSVQGGVTGGDFAPDGSSLTLRTYLTAWLWRRDGQTSVADALTAVPCPLTLASEPQGEALAAEASALWTVSEGANPTLYRIPLQ